MLIGVDRWLARGAGYVVANLLIVGASVRGAVFSAVRAGYGALAADGFGDLDLRAVCPAWRVEEYPAGLEAVARECPAGPWMYTGGLENHPATVDRIAEVRELLGNSGRVLRAVRDPFRVVEALRRAGVPFLAVSRTRQPDASGGWIRKPRKSAGGGRMALVTADEDAESSAGDAAVGADADFYYQRFMRGMPCSAVYVAAAGWSMLLGVTRQLVGTAWTGACGFQYAGSLGPLDLDDRATRLFREIGDCLASRFGLVGLFGVDAVLAEGQVWPVEVNPRYTASIETLEQAYDADFLPLHVAACRHGELAAWCPRRTDRRAGKAILYVTEPGRVPASLPAMAQRLNSDLLWPILADVPGEGSPLRPGQPLLTVLAAGASLVEVYHRLRALAVEVRGVRCEVRGEG